MTCPRCDGRVMPATDEWGQDDTHCIACGWRLAPTFSPEALERIAAVLQVNGRTESSMRRAAKKLAM